MHRTISGLVAAIAVMTAGAAPALACGLLCQPLRAALCADRGRHRLRHLRRLGL